MKLPELLQSLNRISANGLSRHAQPEVVIPVYQPGSLGGQAAVPVTHVNLGFDWDQGKLFLESYEKLTLLSAEEVEDIRKHASLGQNRESHQRYVMLTNLLARIHRDGGQYVRQHGMDKAFADADRIVAELYAAPIPDTYDEAVERAAFEAWHKERYPAVKIRVQNLLGTHTDTQVECNFETWLACAESHSKRFGGHKFEALIAAPVSEAKAQGVVMPEGWIPLTIEHEPGYPEDVAFGPKRMMDRLKKWLDRYFEMRLNASTVQQVSVPASAFASRAITHYEAALLAAFPSGSSGEVFNQWNEARRVLAAAPAAPAADAGIVAVEWAKDAEEWGPALNEAGWLFLSELNEDPQKSALIFNNTKGPLRAAIMKYAEIVTAHRAKGVV